jgi:hypothetical protein
MRVKGIYIHSTHTHAQYTCTYSSKENAGNHGNLTTLIDKTVFNRSGLSAKIEGSERSFYHIKKGGGMIQEIKTSEIESMPVITNTGKDFDRLTMATMWLRNGTIIDALFDQHGEPVTAHSNLKKLESYFTKSFRLGQIDGMKCLIGQSRETVHCLISSRQSELTC